MIYAARLLKSHNGHAEENGTECCSTLFGHQLVSAILLDRELGQNLQTIKTIRELVMNWIAKKVTANKHAANSQIVASFVSLLLFPIFANADDWSQWRGEQRDGKSAEKGLLAKWPEGGPKLIWQSKNLGSGYSTPSVVGEQLFVIANQGNEKEEVFALSTANDNKLWSTAIVVALQKSTGATIWKSAMAEGDAASYSSPITSNVNGIKQYVLFLGKGIVGLQADSGKLLWRYTKTSDAQANIATPIVKGNFVYSAASRVGGGLVEVTGSKNEPKEIYFAKSLPAGMGGSILIDGNLFGSIGATMSCVDYLTGTIKWQDRGIGSSAVCFADGKLYLHSDKNELAMIEASPEGYKSLGTCTPPGTTDHGNAKAWTHPVISNGRLYIRDQGDIWCYDIRG